MPVVGTGKEMRKRIKNENINKQNKNKKNNYCLQ
jgi:hypothetical protein